ncbi:GMC oxidoreductase [Paenirhodobacter sp. CAU 1674]|uniref:GMC oxidoreductase n=1 Tax=Paenirhodobacter sp. CAU 1674 TaxID=3032596 RepID=UPI0023DBE8A0|nr:GMC oxidoreductase [Paenirhodobacter sp. CAU 1674]MDF2141197.1 GMC oxidoreductase [Paenirhodobacter sp. CAU 1674]
MITDLDASGDATRSSEFVVIGAGTVGLPTAVKLAKKGRSVTCLESGTRHQEGETHPLNEVVHKSMHYEGAVSGRFRCLGGTSTRWGGALIPFQDEDLKGAGWPLTRADLDPYLPGVEEFFSLADGPYRDTNFPYDLGEGHVPRLAKWPTFAKRNLMNVVGGEAEASDGPDLWMNATVVSIEILDKGVVVTAKAPGGASLRVEAEKLIIAAGAVETTRLALLIDSQNKGVISKLSPALGRYFADHVSIEVAEIHARKLKALNKIVGFRFGRKGRMRNLRFELAPDSPARIGQPPSFIHIGFEVTKPGGFDVLRELFQYIQKRRRVPMSVIRGLVANSPWLMRAVWWRFAHKRLLFPNAARLLVHVVVEQQPMAENCITLSECRTDQYGVPLAEIDWRVTETDISNLRRSRDAFRRTWRKSRLSELGEWEDLPDASLGERLKHSGGIYHPTGSTRMGHTPEEGVVDASLRLWGAPQVQLLATSVLPTGGGANPTMMLFLLTERLLNQHLKQNQ